MKERCSEARHTRASMSIRPYGNTWRAECSRCGTDLIRVSSKTWRELATQPEAAPGLVSVATAPAATAPAATAPAATEPVAIASCDDEKALKLTAMICKIEIEHGSSAAIYDRAYILGVYFDVLDALNRRAKSDAHGRGRLGLVEQFAALPSDGPVKPNAPAGNQPRVGWLHATPPQA
jgi:hypothetical protein